MEQRFSPGVTATVLFCGVPQHLHVNVWFSSKEEIDKLIDALTELRDTGADDFDHLHLQNHRLAKHSPANSTEVTFFRPGRSQDELEHSMAIEADDWLGAARRGIGKE